MNFINTMVKACFTMALTTLVGFSAYAQCDTVTNLAASDSVTLYLSNNGGYVAGHNGYGDVSKVDYFPNVAGATSVTAGVLWIGAASAANTFSTFNIRVWDATGTGGSPGTILATTTYTYSQAAADVAAGDLSWFSFTVPANVAGQPYFLGIDFTYAAGDTVALVTTQDGNSVNANAWEQWSGGGGWYAYANAPSWGLAITHAIWSIECGGSSNVIDAAVQNPWFGEYTFYPLSQIRPLSISGEVFNNGNATTTNSSLTVTITELGGGVQVYNQTMNGGTLNAGQTVSLNMPMWTPGGLGLYELQFLSSVTEPDQNEANDTTWRYVVVDDSTMCRDDWFIYQQTFSGLGWTNPAGLDMGTYFETTTTDDLSSVTFVYSVDTITSVGNQMRVNCYSANGLGRPGALIASTGWYTIPDDSARIVTLSFANPLTLSPGRYFIGVENVPFLSYVEDIYTPGAIWGGSTAGGWTQIDSFGYAFAYMVWANFGSAAACPTVNVNMNSINDQCNSGSGSASATPFGGTAPYSYAWSNGGNTATITGLTAGNYAVTVTDNNGCTGTGSVVVGNTFPTINMNAFVQQACNGANGFIALNPSGGQAPYGYQWNNGSNASILIALAPGSYFVTVTDANGCTATNGYGISDTCATPTCNASTNLWVAPITPGSARLNWAPPAGGAHHYGIQGGRVGLGPIPEIIIPAGSPNYKDVFGLTNNISYWWQIRSYCDAAGTIVSPWSMIDTFTAECSVSDSTWTSNITTQTAVLNWSPVIGAAGYKIVGRRVGTGGLAQIVVGNASTQKLVAGLISGATYEWGIQTLCSNTGNNNPSDVTPFIQFTTATAARLGNEPVSDFSFEATDISVFPNPASELVTITLSDNLDAETATIKLYDISGKTVEVSMTNTGNNQVELDVSKIAGGVYQLNIESGSTQTIERLVVTH